MFFVSPNGFADKNTVFPNFNLVNQPSLDKILKAEVFIHTDGQLRVAHLILDYIPISKSFHRSAWSKQGTLTCTRSVLLLQASSPPLLSQKAYQG